MFTVPKITVHVKHTHNILVTCKANAVTHTLESSPLSQDPDDFHFATGERTSGPNFRIKHSFSLTAILTETVKKTTTIMIIIAIILIIKNAALQMRTWHKNGMC